MNNDTYKSLLDRIKQAQSAQEIDIIMRKLDMFYDLDVISADELQRLDVAAIDRLYYFEYPEEKE